MRSLTLHIGTHKTGSTSLQYFLRDRRDELEKAGHYFYRGEIEDENHLEFHVAAMRAERGSFSKQKYSIVGDEGFRNRLATSLARQVNSTQAANHIISAEGLYLLRHDDELEWLRGVLSRHYEQIKIILVTREPSAFLRSLEAQIKKVPGRNPSSDANSHLYVGPDSWLADYPGIEALWKRHFGADSLTKIDYDAAVHSHGNVLPPLVHALGLPKRYESVAMSYRENVTRPSLFAGIRARLAGAIRRLLA